MSKRRHSKVRTKALPPASRGQAVDATPRAGGTMQTWSYQPRQVAVPPSWWGSPFPPGKPIDPSAVNVPRERFAAELCPLLSICYHL